MELLMLMFDRMIGKAAIDVVAIYTNTGDGEQQLIMTISQYLGRERTNNQAEYSALIASLLAAIRLQCKYVKLHSDSEVLVKQINNTYQTKDPILDSLRLTRKRLLKEFDWDIVHGNSTMWPTNSRSKALSKQ
jgi:ribonuclease HI